MPSTSKLAVRRGTWTAVLTVLVAASGVFLPPSLGAGVSHRDVWRDVINHGRISAGEDVVVSTKQGTLRGRRIAGDDRAGKLLSLATPKISNELPVT